MWPGRAGSPGLQGRLSLVDAFYALGRRCSSTHADVVLGNPYVSRLHAQITQDRDRFRIRDLRSKNGTFLNGSRIDQDGQWLQSGDKVEIPIDEVVLTFKEDDGFITRALPQTMAELVVDPNSREVWVGGNRLSPLLSRKEFDILQLLYEQRGKACSRDAIAAAGWPKRADKDVAEQEIDQYIRRIRRRIEPAPSRPTFITTVRGYGYKLT